MARRRGNTFNFLQASAKADDFSVKPIKAEFGGSLPSLFTELIVHLHGQDGEEDLK